MKEEKDAGASKKGDIEAQYWNSFLEKDLEAALDSFDNLFCRRCLVSTFLALIMLCCFLLSSLIVSSLFFFFPVFGRSLIVDYMDVLRTLSFL